MIFWAMDSELTYIEERLDRLYSSHMAWCCLSQKLEDAFRILMLLWGLMNNPVIPRKEILRHGDRLDQIVHLVVVYLAAQEVLDDRWLEEIQQVLRLLEEVQVKVNQFV
jgi:hypothetical protein